MEQIRILVFVMAYGSEFLEHKTVFIKKTKWMS
jgi:hypothetical protein